MLVKAVCGLSSAMCTSFDLFFSVAHAVAQSTPPLPCKYICVCPVEVLVDTVSLISYLLRFQLTMEDISLGYHFCDFHALAESFTIRQHHSPM